MPIVAKHLIANSNFLAGFGVVEDGYHTVAQLEGFTADTVVEGDQRLLRRSRELMPSLPVDDIDVLIIDEMGKNISGAAWIPISSAAGWSKASPSPNRRASSVSPSLT